MENGYRLCSEYAERRMGAVAKTLLTRRPLFTGLVLVAAALISVIVILPAKGGTPYPITDVGMVDPSQGLWHLRNGNMRPPSDEEPIPPPRLAPFRI